MMLRTTGEAMLVRLMQMDRPSGQPASGREPQPAPSPRPSARKSLAGLLPILGAGDHGHQGGQPEQGVSHQARWPE